MIENPITTYVENVKQKASTHRSAIPWIPRADADLANLGINASEKLRTSGLSLLPFTAADLAADSTEFQTCFVQRSKHGSTRTPVSKRLGELNREINTNIERPKDYLSETYGTKNARNYYGLIGIEKGYNGYKIPTDRQKCMISLKKLINFASSEGWDSRIYNAAYWQGILDEYSALAAQCTDTAGNVSKLVNDKKLMKGALILKLQSVMHLVRANYPNSAEAELRSWGFQRETF